MTCFAPKKKYSIHYLKEHAISEILSFSSYYKILIQTHWRPAKTHSLHFCKIFLKTLHFCRHTTVVNSILKMAGILQGNDVVQALQADIELISSLYLLIRKIVHLDMVAAGESIGDDEMRKQTGQLGCNFKPSAIVYQGQ